MFLTFKQQQQTIYLDAATHVDANPKIKYNIILSPNLYWIKKVSLPLKHARDVKKIAHTLFEESIPENTHYSYHVYQKADNFFVFAYNDKEILSLLESKGIVSTNINAIFFAQSELDTVQGTYKVNDTQALQVKDDVVILLPLGWFETLQPLNLTDMVLSGEKIKLQQFNHLIDNNIMIKIIILLLLLIIVLGVELFIYKHQDKRIVQQKEKIFTKYHLKPTMMQNRSILSYYMHIDKKQTKAREIIANFLEARLVKGEKIESIFYEGGLIKVVISHTTKEDVGRIMAPFFKQKIKFTSYMRNNNLVVEVKV